MNPCGSVNVINHGNELDRYPCTLDAGHHGDCVDATGLHWTRLSELLRRLGLELAGHQVRKVPPDDPDPLDHPAAE